MNAGLVEATLRLHITEMRERLDRAASIARAAQACAEASSIDKAVEIALDVEPLIHEASTFLNAAALINRIDKT